MPQHDISEYQLHAYVDDQLDLKERDELTEQIKHDQQLSQYVHDIRQIKHWVREAYQSPPQAAPTDVVLSLPSSVPPIKALVASALLALGSLAGWLGHDVLQSSAEPRFHDVSQLAGTPLKADRVLIHISKMERDKIQSALVKAEELLRQSEQAKRPLQLEIVANAEGLGLLREGSPFTSQIDSLSRKHNNIRFLACGIAMENVRLKEGKKAQLLPQAQQIDAALEQILRRLKEGWSYIRG